MIVLKKIQKTAAININCHRYFFKKLSKKMTLFLNYKPSMSFAQSFKRRRQTEKCSSRNPFFEDFIESFSFLLLEKMNSKLYSMNTANFSAVNCKKYLTEGHNLL
jgi:hypothetical protein